MLQTGLFLQEKVSSCMKFAKNSVNSNRNFGKRKPLKRSNFKGFSGGGAGGIRTHVPFGQTVFKSNFKGFSGGGAGGIRTHVPFGQTVFKLSFRVLEAPFYSVFRLFMCPQSQYLQVFGLNLSVSVSPVCKIFVFKNNSSQ